MHDKPWLKGYDPEVPAHITYPAINVVQLFAETVRKFPERPCTIFKGAILTYQEMQDMIDGLGSKAG
jgi:hypothetical protein